MNGSIPRFSRNAHLSSGWLGGILLLMLQKSAYLSNDPLAILLVLFGIKLGHELNHLALNMWAQLVVAWNPKQPFINGCLVISNHFLCKDLVHHPIDFQPFIKGWLQGVPGG